MTKSGRKADTTRRVRNTVWSAVKVLTLATGVVSLGAQAQAVLEEVVVTAQKRVESLSDVPISVNVVDATKIADSGITNLNDLTDFVPNLSMNQTGIGTNITIRGISSGINPAFEQSVGMFVDDVYYGRAQLARVPYLDLARVEVLRGPQPILFGKNAIAGAISMITEHASTEGLDGFVQAEYNFDQEGTDFSGAVNFPLGDRFGVRLAALKRDSDGYYENTNLGDRSEAQLDEQVLRASFRWEPTDSLTADFKIENAQFDTKGRFLEIINPVEVGGSPSYATVLAGLTGGAVILDAEQDFKRQSNGDINETEVDNATLKIDWLVGDITMTSITSRVEYEDYQQCDCDFVSASLIDTSGREKFEQFSQEFRFTSEGGETIDWIGGVFYQDYDVELNDITIVPGDSLLGALSSSLLGTGARRAYDQDSELWSAFAQVTWNINDSWRLTLGGRYSEEEKSGSRSITTVDILDPSPVRDILGQPITSSPIAPLVYAGGFGIDNEQANLSGLTDCGGADDAIGHNLACDKDEDSFTPAVNLQWDATEDAMVYVSYTEGFKAGGFDARANNTGSFEFDEELATSYELGSKMTLADGRAELNVALYRTEYEDLQTSQFDGTLGFNVTNAGEATVQGIELDGRWQATDSLLFSYAAGILDFEFDSFPNSQCYFGEESSYPDGSELAGLCDRSGDTREFTPELTANLGGQYFFDIGGSMELTVGLDLIYSDEYFVSPTLDPNLEQDSYTKLNGRIALADNDGRWQVAVLFENITDEEILTFGNQAPTSTTLSDAFNNAIGAPGVATAYYGFYTAPYNVALQARYNF
ncbi:MAG: TonB-dependent receptor [Halieaceae bacterium]|nr:TonB-dependent receptor [Halieaceae bacterium]